MNINQITRLKLKKSHKDNKTRLKCDCTYLLKYRIMDRLSHSIKLSQQKHLVSGDASPTIVVFPPLSPTNQCLWMCKTKVIRMAK